MDDVFGGMLRGMFRVIVLRHMLMTYVVHGCICKLDVLLLKPFRKGRPS